MRISQIAVRNFRCLDDIDLSLDPVTVLVGANGTGKSSVLHAVAWFFDGGQLELADIGGDADTGTVAVGVTFEDLSSADAEAFGSYVVDDQLQLWRTWNPADGEKLTGRGLAYPVFSELRQHNRASEINAAYGALREAHPDLGLSTTRSAEAAKDALNEWERQHPDALELTDREATHLFGFVGQGRLNGRFDYVLVPAVADPAAEARDAPRTMLRQLVDRSGAHSARMRERLSALEVAVTEQINTIVGEEGQDTFEALSASVTEELARLVPEGMVALEARPPSLQVPMPGVELRVGDGGHMSDVSHQGHGFQRALLIAMVQQLVRAEQQGDPPGLFLALEEPELYQHPVQARHFARTLADLARSGEGAIQVAYATHSEHFVDPSRYERLRRFRKRRQTREWPTAEVTQATIERVASRVAGVIPAAEIPLRVKITMRRQLAEAVFASAVMLVEGHTDAALFSGLAERTVGLDAAGVAVVATGSKSRLAVPWAILEELGVPTYVVFDGDSGVEARMQSDGKDPLETAEAFEGAGAENVKLLELLGVTAEAHPPTTVGDVCAVFHDRLEEELAAWSGFQAKLAEFRFEDGEFRAKSEDLYRHAAIEADDDPPETLTKILSSALARR